MRGKTLATYNGKGRLLAEHGDRLVSRVDYIVTLRENLFHAPGLEEPLPGIPAINVVLGPRDLPDGWFRLMMDEQQKELRVEVSANGNQVASAGNVIDQQA